ncbi:MAG: glycoside hydrolase family 97 N-terminal domain-containing protein, partial [Balneolaceae bacterium]
MKKKRIQFFQIAAGFLILFAGFNVHPAVAQGQEPVLQSPDGQIEVAFTTGEESDSGAEPVLYSVSYKGNLLIDASGLELHLEGEAPLGSDVRIAGINRSENNTETYQLVAGKTSSVATRYNTLSLELEENSEPGCRLVIEARAYNDGVALRYLLPE